MFDQFYHAPEEKKHKVYPISLKDVIILQKTSAKKKSLNLTGPKGEIKIFLMVLNN